MSAHRPVAMGHRYAISAGHSLAAQAGYEILRAGGNAIDAGVAAGMVLGVVHSDLVGFAGVAPIMIRLAGTGEVITIDGLGVWPRAADVSELRREHDGAIPHGLLRTVVPAAPAAWIWALERYGTLGFADVATAAMEHARDGFVAYPLFSDFVAENEAGYGSYASNREIYLPRGRPPRVGERFMQPDLARTIQYMIDEERAHGGEGREAGLRAARDAFYCGDIARTICSYHAANGGWLAMEDLAGYQVREEPPVSVPFGRHTLYCCGPWSQGIALAQAATLVNAVDVAALGHNTPEYVHAVTELLKLAFADRERYVGDPAFVDVPAKEMLDPEYLSARAQLVDSTRAWPVMPPPGDPRTRAARIENAEAPSWIPPMISDPHATIAAGAADTSYVAVMDELGNVFSATPSDTSADTEVIPGTGLAVSSRGSQSRTEADHPACVEPGKRPRLTPNPAMVLNGSEPVMAFGTPGGDVQIQAMLQVLLNVDRFGMDIQSAIEAPRFATYSFPSWFAPNAYHPGLLAIESRFDPATLRELESRGHRLQHWPAFSWRAGGVCAVCKNQDEGVLHAGADPRRAGYALAR